MYKEYNQVTSETRNTHTHTHTFSLYTPQPSAPYTIPHPSHLITRVCMYSQTVHFFEAERSVRDHQKEKEKKTLEAEIRAQIAIEVTLHAIFLIPVPFPI